jgi:hypothetical protein
MTAGVIARVTGKIRNTAAPCGGVLFRAIPELRENIELDRFGNSVKS